jgi:tetratricopeptide (TPR) repeat protein
VLSEQALIVAVVLGACVLLILGVLELIWPTRRRRPRRARAEPAPARPIPAAPARPAQSILPRRLVDSPSASRPSGGFAFPPPADYVPPPLPREEVRPIRPAERSVRERSVDVVEPPAADAEEAAYSPPAEYVAPTPPGPVPASALEVPPFLLPIEEPAAPSALDYVAPPIDVPPATVETERRRSEPAPAPVEPEPDFEPEAPYFEPEPPDFEPESQRPEAQRFEPEPSSVEAAPPLVIKHGSRLIESIELRVEPEPKPRPLEPAPTHVEPKPPPVVHTTFERVAPPPEQVEPPPAQPPAPPLRRRRSRTSPHARPHRVLRPGAPEGRAAEQSPPSIATSTPPATPAKSPLPMPNGPAEPASKTGRDSPLVERCFTLYQGKRFDEVLTVGEEALARLRHEAPQGPSRETAALWSVVGLAKQALGDDDGAHTALESSIEAASESERATYRRHLATLALEAAQARLTRAGTHEAGDRMSVIRGAIAWTERGLKAVASDQALADAREEAHDALWQAYEQAATALLQRQEFPAARQLLHEALDDPKLPAARAASFRGLLSGTFGGEIGQLTAQAILSMQDGRESEAIGILQRAEELLETIPADTLPPTRRDEVDQRLWWGYAELGSRRLDAGDYEEALDPLVHALRFTSIGPERQAETRAAVVRALEGIAAVRALSIRRLAEAGSRDEAIVAAGELHGLVKRGLELGLSEDELVAAFARVRRLCEELGMDIRV